MTTKRDERTRQLEAEVTRLTELVEGLRARLDVLASDGNGQSHGDSPKSRRDLLKLAGAATIGAAGGVVLRSTPAAAATGSFMTLGATNDSALPTNNIPTTLSTPSPLFQALGQRVALPVVPPTTDVNHGGQSVPVIGAIAADGHLPTVSGVVDYPGFAPIQGVGGSTQLTANGPVNSEGINGYGFGITGIGVIGESDMGYGVVGGSGGIDVAALGHGRILQAPADAGLLNTDGSPAYFPNAFEQLRTPDGALWVSQAAPPTAPVSAFWRRVTSVVPITPVRIIDTRSGLGGIRGPLPSGSTNTWQIAGLNGIPSGAIAVIANFTVVDFNMPGWIAVFPAGTVWSGTSTVNFPPGAQVGTAIANGFMAPFGTGPFAGHISILNNGQTDVVVDANGYLL